MMLLILAGADYAAPIREAMRVKVSHPEGGWRLNCVGVREPLQGLGPGARLRWFAQAWRERAQAPAKAPAI